jgi:hypothetical protein
VTFRLSGGEAGEDGELPIAQGVSYTHPDMSGRKNVALDARSGLIVVSA